MLDPTIKALAQAKNFATLTTLSPSGQPETSVMWVGADDEYVLINTETHRRKFANVSRDPRVSLAIWELDNPYHYAEVRGTVVETITGPQARAHIDELSEKYTGGPYGPEIQSERVILRISPDRQRTQ